MVSTEQCLVLALKAFFRNEKCNDLPLSRDGAGALFALCTEQHVLPMVFEALYDNETVKNDASYRAVRMSAISSAASQTERSEAFCRIYAKLRSEGINALAVKGILCRNTYEKGHLRVSADEDLLVPEKEYSSCCRILSENGFSRTAPEKDGDEESGWCSENCYIEVHSSLLPKTSDSFARLNALFPDVFESPCPYRTENGCTVYSLDPRKHLLYLILHAYKHFVHSGFGIRQVCDIGMWADRYKDKIDSDLLFADCESAGITVFAKAVFMLAADMTSRDSVLFESFANIKTDPAPMLADMLSGGVYGTNDLSRAHSASVTVRAAEENRSGIKNVISALFPSAKRLSSSYPVLKKHPALLPFIWIKRIVKYKKETDTEDRSDAAESLRIAKERTRLLRLYGIIK